MKTLPAAAAALAAFAMPALAPALRRRAHRLFDHAGGETCIPEVPQAIAGLHDQSVTLTLP